MCRSYDFKEPGESKIPLEDYYDMEKNVNESPLEFCKRMNWDDYIYSMIVVDFLISNRDRHGDSPKEDWQTHPKCRKCSAYQDNILTSLSDKRDFIRLIMELVSGFLLRPKQR